MDINRFSVVTSTNAAKYFGLFPKKGILQVGSDADIVVFDPKVEWTVASELLHENCDYTPYEGFALKGKVRDVFLRGNHKVSSGNITVEDTDGQYLKRDLPITSIR
jgi:dihydropyrimidinase